MFWAMLFLEHPNNTTWRFWTCDGHDVNYSQGSSVLVVKWFHPNTVIRLGWSRMGSVRLVVHKADAGLRGSLVQPSLLAVPFTITDLHTWCCIIRRIVDVTVFRTASVEVVDLIWSWCWFHLSGPYMRKIINPICSVFCKSQIQHRSVYQETENNTEHILGYISRPVQIDAGQMDAGRTGNLTGSVRIAWYLSGVTSGINKSP